MTRVSVSVSVDTAPTPRMRQVSAMFDAPIAQKAARSWTGDVPLDERPWQIGFIVGASGAGKSTIARELFGAEARYAWPASASVVDSFDASLSVETISRALSAVGFNTIPAWLRPYGTLSNGEKFRCDLARALVDPSPRVWVDEFTSVVDRQVAKIGAHALARFVRSQPGRQFVAVGCHYDVIDWLQPDWILEPAEMTFTWRSVQPRPRIEGVIRRCSRALWPRFAPYHYMTAALHPAARCWSLDVDDRPIAFVGVIPMPVSSGRRKGEAIDRVSRVVVLPDWQGCGAAFRLLETLGSAFAAVGRRFRNYPAAPGFVAAHRRKPTAWRETTTTTTTTSAMMGPARPCSVFEFTGPSMTDRKQAERLLALG